MKKIYARLLYKKETYNFLAIKKEVTTKIGKGKNLLPLSWFMKEIKREGVVYALMLVVVL
jgi:hypothetical protein